MFALSLVQYPGIVFPRMDPLRCDRYPACRSRPLFFLRIKLEEKLLLPLVLVYPCLTAFFTFTIWLLFFS